MFHATISFQALLLLHSINLDTLCFHFVTYGVLAIEWLPLNLRFILSACSMVMEHILTIFSLPTGIEAFLVDVPEKCCKKKRGSLPDSFVLAQQTPSAWLFLPYDSCSACSAGQPVTLSNQQLSPPPSSHPQAAWQQAECLWMLQHSQLPQGLAPIGHRNQQPSMNSLLPPSSRQISGKFHQCSTMTSLSFSELQSYLSNKIQISSPGSFYLNLEVVTTS